MNNFKIFADIRKNELSDYINFFLHQSHILEKKFIIFAHYRTGSTLLADLFNCHPDILCDGEIFLKFMNVYFKKVFSPSIYAESQSLKSNKKIYSCDVKLDQLVKICIKQLNCNPQNILNYFHQNNWKIIYLHRENLLNKVLSNIKANTRQKWHDLPEDKLKRDSIDIDVNKLIKQMKWAESLVTQEQEIIRTIPHLKIIYENNLLHSKDHQNTANMIFDYLGLESVSVTSSMKKVSLNSVWDDVENAQEVIDFIKQTEYSIYL